MRLQTIFPLLFLLTSLPASAAMYKWKDANGNIQYGQHPPAGVKAENIRPAPTPKSTPATQSPQEQVKQLEKRLEKENTEKAEADEKKRVAENRKINCANARKNLEKLNYGGNRLVHMPDGSYQRMDQKKKQDMVKKNQDAIKEFCD